MLNPAYNVFAVSARQRQGPDGAYLSLRQGEEKQKECLNFPIEWQAVKYKMK